MTNFEKRLNTLGLFVLPDGRQEQAFLRFRAQPQEKERVALQFVANYPIPASQFLGMIQIPEACALIHVLIQTYIEGIDLDELLPASKERPILPGEGASQRSRPVSPDIDLSSLVEELGRVISKLHHVETPGFGSLVSSSRTDGVAFTLEKVQVLLRKSVERGWLSSHDMVPISTWLSERIALFREEERPCFVHSDLHPAKKKAILGSPSRGLAPGEGSFKTLLANDTRNRKEIMPLSEMAKQDGRPGA